MNGLEASKRLREISEILPYIEVSIINAQEDDEDKAADGLTSLSLALKSEYDDLKRRLTETEL